MNNTTGIIDTIEKIRRDIIINAAAYTEADKAELEPFVAEQINPKIISAMADSAEKLGAILVHFLTDYVFNGTGRRPCTESERTEPLNAYGKTKRTEKCSRYLIFRTNWVYVLQKNFLLKAF